MSVQGTNEGGSGFKSAPGRTADSHKRFHSGEGERRTGERPFNSNRFERSSGQGQKTDRPRYDKDRPRYDKDRPRYDKDRPRYDKDRPQGRRDNDYGRFMKDKDDDDRESARRSRPVRPKENKPAVSQPDKTKTQLRLEKEQKTIKKKKDYSTKKKESSRPQPKVKRANNINYTREYMNGAFDDYEDYDE